MYHFSKVCPNCGQKHNIVEDDNMAVVVVACQKCHTLFAVDDETGGTFEVEVRIKQSGLWIVSGNIED